MYSDLLKYLFSEFFSKIVPFFTTLYLAVMFSPGEFGKYSLAIVYFELVFIFSSYCIQASTRIDFYKQSESVFNDKKRNHIFLLVPVCLLLMDEGWWIVLIFVFTSFIKVLSSFLMSIFQCLKRSSAYVVSNIAFVVVFSSCVVLLVNHGYGYRGWFYAMLTASLVQFFVCISLYGRVDFFTNYVFGVIEVKNILAVVCGGFVFMPQAVGWWLKNGADRLIINRSLGEHVLGSYSLAFQFAMLIIIGVSVFNLAYVPEVNSQLRKLNFNKVRSLLLQIFCLIVISVVFVVVFFGGVIERLYASNYIDVLHYFYLLVGSVFPQAFLMVYVNVLYFFDQGLFVAKVLFLLFLVQVVVNLLVVDCFGVEGVVSTSFITNVVALVVVFYKSKKYLSEC